MTSVGTGCREIRVKTGDGIYRIMYVTKFDDRIYVLHSFVKKSQRTSQADIETGKRRYKMAQQIAKDRRQETA